MCLARSVIHKLLINYDNCHIISVNPAQAHRKAASGLTNIIWQLFCS